MKLDLLILILLAFNHLFTLIISDSSCNDICSAEMLSMGQIKMLSSANKIKRKNSGQLENSLIHFFFKTVGLVLFILWKNKLYCMLLICVY